MSETLQRFERRITDATLYRSDATEIHIAQVGEFLLRYPELLSKLFNRAAEGGLLG